MHLLDCYSLNCGLKIREPFITEKFFPLDVQKYITLDSSAMFPARQYDYWADVVAALHPILDRHGISILHIGSGEQGYQKTYDLRDQATNNQIAYIINGALLHLSVDGFSNHLASYFDKKLVSLFGESPPENNAPVFSEESNYRFLTPSLSAGNFSYSAQESPKSINSITPESIVESVCSLLNIDYDYPFKTLFIGDQYNSKSVELIPKGNPVDAASLNIDSLIMRMDINFDENCLSQQLQINKCSIITEKPINLNLLKHLKGNISQFVYLIGDTDSKQYVEDLFRSGIQCLLMTEKKGEELNALKFKYLNTGKIHQRMQGVKPKELEGVDLNNVYYRTSKYIINDGRVYYNRAAFEQDLPVDIVGSDKLLKVIDDDLFWKDSDSLYLVEKV
jgi:hypothetical protein